MAKRHAQIHASSHHNPPTHTRWGVTRSWAVVVHESISNPFSAPTPGEGIKVFGFIYCKAPLSPGLPFWLKHPSWSRRWFCLLLLLRVQFPDKSFQYCISARSALVMPVCFCYTLSSPYFRPLHHGVASSTTTTNSNQRPFRILFTSETKEGDRAKRRTTPRHWYVYRSCCYVDISSIVRRRTFVAVPR